MIRHASNSSPLVGVDIGGTRIKAGIADADFKILARASAATPESHEPAAVAVTIAELLAELTRQSGVNTSDVAGIGIGVPGRVEPDTGVVLGCANLRGWWKAVPLAELVSAAASLPVAVHNDANAAAFGEFSVARSEDAELRSTALLTLGTGVGGGLVLDGKLLVGRNQMAGEIGHIIVSPGGETCPCGQRGCLERYAAAPALVRAMQRLRPDASELSPPQIMELAATGDADASRVVDDAAGYLAVACINLTRLVDLDLILIGGGLGDAGETLLARIRSAYASIDWTVPTTPPRIEAARLGNDAGWLGAAALEASGRSALAPRPAAAS